MKQRLLVFSADAMVYEDLAYLKTLPNYKRYLEGGAEIKTLKSIYPTVTFPVHESIVTGAYPDRHGIASNYELHPGVLQLPWHWFHKAAKEKDIFDIAKENGFSTAAVGWPVTGNHPSIMHLIADYHTQYPGETLKEAFTRAGSGEGELKIIEKNTFGIEKLDHPECDETIINNSCDIIRQYKPEVLFIHVANIDDYRHKNGIFNEKVARGVEETDVWIGRLMAALEDAGVADETNFFLISDHGQIDIKRIVNINALLADYGLIQKDDSGKLIGWDAYSLSNGLSSLIYLRDPSDLKLNEKTHALLRYLCEEGVYGIGKVYTESEARKNERLGGDFSFVLETDGYTAFGDDWKRPLVKTFDFTDYRYGRATHGSLPDKGPQPMLIARGRGIREATLERRNIVDLAPTFAKLLNLEFPGTDGICINEILK